LRGNETNDYLQQLKQRYRKSRWQEKKLILDEFVKTTGYDRQHAGKLLRGNFSYTTKPIKRPRKRKYDILDAIVLAKVYTLPQNPDNTLR
jgi:carotenoid cleavage dioxygenase-like enzyme